MLILVLIVAAAVVSYLVFNWKRNSDPLNRKCAAEICEYITTHEQVRAEGLLEIFMRNARYRAQAQHIISMVPALLINAGYPKEWSMSFLPILRQSVSAIPR